MPGLKDLLLLAPLAGLLAAPPAQGQLLQPSFNVGAATPVLGEADRFGAGLHVGVGLKLPLIPLQLEGALDRMGADDETADDLTVWSVGLTVPLSVTPPLLPVGLYAIGGAGLYHHAAGESGSTGGLTAGAGIRVGLPGISLFAEGRGVLVLSADRLTWVTAAVGLRL